MRLLAGTRDQVLDPADTLPVAAEQRAAHDAGEVDDVGCHQGESSAIGTRRSARSHSSEDSAWLEGPRHVGCRSLLIADCAGEARRLCQSRTRLDRLRIAFLVYRGNPRCGGQGVYTRHLTRELAALGHSVTVFSGPPYPELEEPVSLVKVASLDLYREPDPFRVPKLHEFTSPVDVARVRSHVHRRVPRAAHLQPPGAAPAGRAPRRVRPRARQPVPRTGRARR